MARHPKSKLISSNVVKVEMKGSGFTGFSWQTLAVGFPNVLFNTNSIDQHVLNQNFWQFLELFWHATWLRPSFDFDIDIDWRTYNRCWCSFNITVSDLFDFELHLFRPTNECEVFLFLKWKFTWEFVTNTICSFTCCNMLSHFVANSISV